MAGLAALAGGGTDEDDVSGCLPVEGGRLGLPIHLRHSRLHQSEDRVEIDGHGPTPLLIGHLGDGRLVGRPDAVIDHENVETAEGRDCGVYQGAAVGWSTEFLADGNAPLRPTALGHESLSLHVCLLVAEGHPCPCRGEHSNRCCSNAARAACDECDLAVQNQRNS